MKVVSSKQMGLIESDAYKDGASEEDFMEQAGKGVAQVIDAFIQKNEIEPNVVILGGKGNNGGDAYVAGCYLQEKGYNVTAYQVVPIKECSPLCQKNFKRFGKATEIGTVEEITFPQSGVIVDGLFGTGFHGVARAPFASVIKMANRSDLPIIAVDIPSGLNGETGEVEGDAICATETVFLQLPKTGFFLQEGWNYVGKLHTVDFGLEDKYIEEASADLFMLTPDILKPLLPPIKRTRHKYEAGFVIGLAGSPGMPGAAILASLGALRGGAGIVRLFHPKGMEAELAASPYELIKMTYDMSNLKDVIDVMNSANATFVGPGLGRTPFARQILTAVLPKLEKPCVIDGDGLTIMAEENLTPPKKSILTPHMGELKRLLGLTTSEPITMEFLHKCQAYAKEKHVTLVLKGGPTFIFHPDEEIMVNPTGNPGMATAGSGDVLTGLIAALLAQGLHARHAAALGVFLHGLAGDYAAQSKTPYCMIASNIIQFFPEAFRLMIH